MTSPNMLQPSGRRCELCGEDQVTLYQTQFGAYICSLCYLMNPRGPEDY